MITDRPARLAPPEHALIERHMHMAAKVAAQYRGRRLDDDELEALAYCALVEAASRYDVAEYPEESFARFAERTIRSALRDALCAAPVVHMGRDRERAVLRGEAEGFQPYGVAVENLGLMVQPHDGPSAEEIERALDHCTDTERSLIEMLFMERVTMGFAARALGMTRRDARLAYESGLRSIAAWLGREGYEPRLAERN